MNGPRVGSELKMFGLTYVFFLIIMNFFFMDLITLSFFTLGKFHKN